MSTVEERLAALEVEVADLREHLADTSLLARHADQDVAAFRSELRAQTRLIQALHETQVGQGRVLSEHGRVLADHGRVLGELGSGVTHIIGLMNTLIRREEGGPDGR